MLHFLVLFIGFIVTIQLTFTFIYNTFSVKNFQFQLNKPFQMEFGSTNLQLKSFLENTI